MSLFRKKDKKTNNNDVIFNSKLEPYIYLLPFVLGLVVFTIYPIINVVLMAFKEGYKLNGAFTGWGIGNFTKIFSDRYFLSAFKNTFTYVFIVVPIATCISILVANLLNQKTKGIAIFQTAFFLPMVTSAIAVGLVWKYMFNNEIGVVNFLLKAIGLNPINWLGATAGNAQYNIWAVIIFGIWNMIPFTTILLLSGLQNIDPLYYTAAKVDGASTTKMFFRITIPLLSPTIFLTMIVNMISAFKIYNEIIPFWNGSAGVTGTNLYTFVYYIKEQFATYGRYGLAAAASIVLFIIIFVFTMIQRYIQSKANN
ncbi:MAG: sugar ABC transporter permease [Erysipelotrichaceae bacterium]|nr:sugar ABC transporter permease [Erysipelotrichaceae bacterium]